MAHIKFPQGAPGILGPMKAYPETAKPLNTLAELLLVKDTLHFSKADRELVASYVSYLNQCVFCSESHAAVANFHAKKPGYSQKVWENIEKASISDLLKSYLRIAAKVQKDARSVTKADVDAAIKLGATEEDIHDTVLISAAFCMYNRYVDGLQTLTPPRGNEVYNGIGEMLGTKGYKNAA